MRLLSEVFLWLVGFVLCAEGMKVAVVLLNQPSDIAIFAAIALCAVTGCFVCWFLSWRLKI